MELTMLSTSLHGLLALFFLFSTVACDTCPSEAPPINGRKLFGSPISDGKCETFKLIDWNHYKTYQDQNWQVYQYIADVFCKEFKGGSAAVVEDSDFFKGQESSWIHEVNWDVLLHGIFITEYRQITKYFEDALNYYIRIFSINYVFADNREFERRKYKLTHTFWSRYYIGSITPTSPYVPWVLKGLKDTDDIENYLEVASFTDPRCPYSEVKSGRVIEHSWLYRCNELYEKNIPTISKCYNQMYKDCDEGIIYSCTYFDKLNKWYDRYPTIFRNRELPYGKPCRNRTLADVGAKECNASCRATWEPWSEVPIPACGVYELHRYRAPHAGDKCTDKSICCMEVKIIHAEDACEDFAYNTTINLKKLGCKNNRKTIVGPLNHLVCDCGEQFTGIQCENDLCKNRCMNGGTCIPYGNGSLCLCPHGFKGDNCAEKSTTCGSTGSCLNGGTCIPTSDERGAYCKCATGYGGDSCGSKAEYCQRDSCNWRGACYNITEAHSIKCKCHHGFTGPRCEITMAATFDVIDAASGIGTVAISALVVFALFTFLTGGVVVHRRRRRRRRRMSTDSTVDSSFYSTLSTIGSKFGFSTRRPQKRDKNKGTKLTTRSDSHAVGLSMKGATARGG